MKLGLRPHDGHVVVLVAGRVDLHTAEDLASYLEDLIDEGHRHVVIDVFDATVWTPGSFDPLEAARGRIRSLGGWLCVVGPDGLMRRGFRFRALSAPLDRADGGAWSAPDPAEPALGAGSLPDAFVSIRDAIAVAGAHALGAALTTAIGWSLAAITATTDGASRAIDVARRCSPQETGGVRR